MLSQWKSREAVRGALVALQSRLNDMSPSQVSVEITRILLMLDDTYIPPAASSLSSPNLTPPAAAGAAPAAASGGGGAPLQTTHSMQVVSTSFVPPKGHSSKRLSVGSLSEFIEVWRVEKEKKMMILIVFVFFFNNRKSPMQSLHLLIE